MAPAAQAAPAGHVALVGVGVVNAADVVLVGVVAGGVAAQRAIKEVEGVGLAVSGGKGRLFQLLFRTDGRLTQS